MWLIRVCSPRDSTSRQILADRVKLEAKLEAEHRESRGLDFLPVHLSLLSETFVVKMEYIRQKHLKGLHPYKYAGVDHSLVSRYVLKPFYNNVVIKCFPMSMA